MKELYLFFFRFYNSSTDLPSVTPHTYQYDNNITVYDMTVYVSNSLSLHVFAVSQITVLLWLSTTALPSVCGKTSIDTFPDTYTIYTLSLWPILLFKSLRKFTKRFSLYFKVIVKALHHFLENFRFKSHGI